MLCKNFFLFTICVEFMPNIQRSESRPQISLEYKPNRPFYASSSSNGNRPGQLVPSGDPWPSSLAGYANFSQTAKPPPSGSSSNSITPTRPNLEDRIQSGSSTVPPQSQGQGRPPFHPSAGDNVGQLIPEGLPWPSKVDDYANFSQTMKPRPPSSSSSFEPTTVNPDLEDRIQSGSSNVSEDTNNRPSGDSGIATVSQGQGRPPFHPNPGDNVGQLIPEGQPWPSKPEDYPAFSQTTVSDRFKPGPGTTATPASGQDRPPFQPSPDSNVGQIVPPGKPWPSRPDDSADFNETSVLPVITPTSQSNGSEILVPSQLGPGSSNISDVTIDTSDTVTMTTTNDDERETTTPPLPTRTTTEDDTNYILDNGMLFTSPIKWTTPSAPPKTTTPEATTTTTPTTTTPTTTTTTVKDVVMTTDRTVTTVTTTNKVDAMTTVGDGDGNKVVVSDLLTPDSQPVFQTTKRPKRRLPPRRPSYYQFEYETYPTYNMPSPSYYNYFSYYPQYVW